MAKITYTLNLYRGDKSDTALAQITIPKGNSKSKVCYAYVKVEPKSDLFKIPCGTNPRALNKESRKVKAIRTTLETMHGFAVFNGGLCVIIDDDSLTCGKEEGNVTSVSFTCEVPDSGHYDGQHTKEGVEQGAPVVAAAGFDQQLSVMLVENRFFKDVPGGSRTAAETWNNRDNQKFHSVQNQRGTFDVMKDYINSDYLPNIGFREHDRNSKKEIIRKECRIDRVISLLYTGIGVLRSEELDASEAMFGMLRAGYNSGKILEDNDKNAEFEKMYPVLNNVLEMSDHIQSTLRSSYDNDTGFDNLEILRKSGKRDLEKSVIDRKHLKQNLFNGEQADESLLPEYIQPIMYGFLKNVLALNTNKEVIVSYGWTINDMKAMWSSACPAVLDRLDELFKKKFVNNFNSRHAEFGCYPLLWTECEEIIKDTILEGEWRQAAAK